MSDQYFPSNPNEKAYLDNLWVAAHQGGDASVDLSGADAVTFFRTSNVDTGILRTIWSLSTPGATMNQNQFYTALRYIQLVQAGDIPISREKLINTMRNSYVPPKFNGISVPSTSSSTLQTNTDYSGGVTHNYAITPEEHIKYHALFVQYDVDKDGYIQSTEAAGIFSKSGLDNNVLAIIWNISDMDRDNKLSPKEFCLAFHLIVCVGKKKMPLPQTLPSSLLAFINNAPAVPVASSSLPVNPSVVPSILPSVLLSAQPSLSASSMISMPSVQSSIITTPTQASSSFMPDIMPPPEQIKMTSPIGARSSISVDEQMDLENSVRGVADIAKRAVASQERSVETTEKASSSLKYVLQKLSAEKVSLSSSLNLVEDDLVKAQGRLHSCMQEISDMQALVDELKIVVSNKKDEVRDVLSSVAAAENEKSVLLKSMEELRLKLDESIDSERALALRVKALGADQAALSAQIDFNNTRAMHLERDVSGGQIELETLRALLSGLESTHARVIDQSRSLSAQASALQMTTADMRSEATATAAKVSALEQQKAEISAEKMALLSTSPAGVGSNVTEKTPDVSSSAGPSATTIGVLATAAIAVPAAVIASTSIATNSMTVEDVDFDDGSVSAEDFPAAQPLGSSYAKFEDDEFPPPESSEILNAFPAAIKNNDGFGSFPAPSTVGDDDGFGSFDSFPAETVDPFKDDVFPLPVSTTSGSDGFDNFESYSKPAGLQEENAADDGFGDFDSFPSVPTSNKNDTIVEGDDGFGDFPPPSGDFSSSYGEFDEESFTSATKNSPW